MTTGPLPGLSKCKSGLPQITGTFPGWGKQSFRLRLWSLVWFQVRDPHHPTSYLRSRLESQHQSVPRCAEECAIRWPVADPGCGSRARHRPTNPKRPSLASEGVLWLCIFLSPYSSLTWTCWTTSFVHTSGTSPTWPATTPKPAWCPPSANYSPNSRRRLWKRHDPSSGSVSRRWLRLKAATLNRYQLYNIINLTELIFSIEVLK